VRVAKQKKKRKTETDTAVARRQKRIARGARREKEFDEAKEGGALWPQEYEKKRREGHFYQKTRIRRKALRGKKQNLTHHGEAILLPRKKVLVEKIKRSVVSRRRRPAGHRNGGKASVVSGEKSKFKKERSLSWTISSPHDRNFIKLG